MHFRRGAGPQVDQHTAHYSLIARGGVGLLAASRRPARYALEPPLPPKCRELNPTENGLGVVARPRRQLAIPNAAQFAAERLLSDDDLELVPNPLAQIDHPPAYHAMNRRDRATLDHRRPDISFMQSHPAWCRRSTSLPACARHVQLLPAVGGLELVDCRSSNHLHDEIDEAPQLWRWMPVREGQQRERQ